MRRWIPSLIALATLSIGGPSPARADEVAEFEQARQAYDAQNYEQAVARFESMVGAETPRIRNPVLILESRKYLGAAYLFVDRRQDAREQFTLLLREDPTYELDPYAFPEAVHQVFREVREDIAAELAEADRQRAESERRLRDEALQLQIAQQERIARLEEIARQEVVERPNSRLVATVPFGVGQFQNGHLTLGRFFAVSQATLVAGTFATWGVHQWASNKAEQFPLSRARLERVGRAMRGLNYSFFSLFGALLVIGIIDAHVRFVPVRREIRERELPDDLLQPVEPRASLSLGVGSFDLRIEF